MLEPGLDRHEWESEWASLEPAALDSPREALPELDDLVRRMLDERGFALDDRVARESTDPEILTEYAAAHEIRLHAERDDPNISPGDIASAVESFRNVYEYLLENRAAG